MNPEDLLDLLARHFGARLSLILIQDDLRNGYENEKTVRKKRLEAEELRQVIDETGAELEALLGHP